MTSIQEKLDSFLRPREMNEHGVLSDPHAWIKDHETDSFTEDMKQVADDIAQSHDRLMRTLQLLVSTDTVEKDDVLAALEAQDEIFE